MRPSRTNALTELKCLAETLRNSKVVLSDRMLVEELRQICLWVDNEGAKSSQFEIIRRIEFLKLKVREQLILS